MSLKRIPFDSLVLQTVCLELQCCLGGKVQRVLKLNKDTVAINVYAKGENHWIQISNSPEFARVHLMSIKPSANETADDFVRLLRQHIDSARILSISTTGLERILKIQFQRADEPKTVLHAELMGKHSNLILVSSDKRILACANAVGPTKSRRIVLVGKSFSSPPISIRRNLKNATNYLELSESEGVSPFLLNLTRANNLEDEETASEFVRNAFAEVSKQCRAYFAKGYGAYPLDPKILGYDCVVVKSLSDGIEQHFSSAAVTADLDSQKRLLISALDRVLLSRNAAIHDLEEALAQGALAAKWQMYGELILAYQATIGRESPLADFIDYEGNMVQVPLDPELSAVENANIYFSKAKKAKSREGDRKDQLTVLINERNELEKLFDGVQKATSVDELDRLAGIAKARKWLQIQTGPKEKGNAQLDPFQGFKIRVLEGPGGRKVLFGENATSNDYLTLRVAKPNDIWLHIRGGTSAHVVIQTSNQPEKIGRELLEFAARVAVRNSPSKHAGFVPVDYTLKKYVKKPRGAAVGTAIYSHEKTLHVENT